MSDKIGTVLAAKGREVHSVGPRATVAEAVGVMNARGTGSVVVMDGGRIVGMFTERDVLVRVVAARLDPAVVRVESVMTHEVIVVEPDTDVETAMRIISEKKCRHLPVMSDGALVGLVSINDLTRWTIRNQKGEIRDLIHYIST